MKPDTAEALGAGFARGLAGTPGMVRLMAALARIAEARVEQDELRLSEQRDRRARTLARRAARVGSPAELAQEDGS